jgi:hypothetical protein
METVVVSIIAKADLRLHAGELSRGYGLCLIRSGSWPLMSGPGLRRFRFQRWKRFVGQGRRIVELAYVEVPAHLAPTLQAGAAQRPPQPCT